MDTKSQQQPVLTVTEITHAIRDVLEPNFRSVQIQGEISNFKRQSSGHLYFSLKDEKAQISAVMFRGSASSLASIPKDGDQVLVKGSLSVYEPRGSYQIVVKELTPVGVGVLLLKLEQLKKEIHKRGWFKKECKKPLPVMPQKIGIITSPTGAAIQDILNVLSRRFGDVHVILNPVRVQGVEAAGEIATAIDEFNRYKLADVLIVGRGGGSLEDLWAFNEEVVAEAIHRSDIPIVCAVGHETDHCIAEYVADLRAPTPSAAAEIVMAEKLQKVDHLKQLTAGLSRAMKSRVDHSRKWLEGFSMQPVFSSPYALLSNWMQKVDRLHSDIDNVSLRRVETEKLHLEGIKKQLAALSPKRQLKTSQIQLVSLEKALSVAARQKIAGVRQKVERLKEGLGALNPKNVLKNGYSILFSEKDKSVINSIEKLHNDMNVRLVLHDGEAKVNLQQFQSVPKEKN